MKPITILVAKYTSFLCIALLVNFWILDFSRFNIPENIPATSIHVRGVVVFLIVLITLIFAVKEIVKAYSDLGVAKLTLKGTLIGLFAEVIFQSVRAFMFEEDRLHIFFKGVVAMTIFDTLISFFVAYQVKTKNTDRLILYIVVLIVVVKLLLFLSPTVLS